MGDIIDEAMATGETVDSAKNMDAVPDERFRVSSTIRTVLGHGARIYPLKDFIIHFAPNLPFKLEEDASTMNEKQRRLMKRLSQTLVSPSDEFLTPLPNITRAVSREPLPMLVDNVVWSLVHQREQVPNILSKGYARASEHLEQEIRPCPNMRAGVVCTRLNGNVSFCKTSKFFLKLHSLVGDDLLRIILMRTSLFLPCDENYDHQEKPHYRLGNYILISGPIPKPTKGLLFACDTKETIKPTKPSSMCSETSRKCRKRKRQSMNAERNEDVVCPSLPDPLKPDASISRRSLFYSNDYIPKVGLPRSHILNTTINGKSEDILVDMIPLWRKGNSGRKCRKRWKRLRISGVAVCEEILACHNRCDYHRILERHCPLPCFVNKKQKHASQVQHPAMGPTAATQSDPGEVSLSVLSAAHTPAEDVVAFLSRILKHVFPASFWGSSDNFERVLQLVTIFVRLRRFEELPNKTLMRGIRVTRVPWLYGNHSRNSKNGSRTDHDAAKQLMTYALRWVFGKYIVPLLRSSFYITESEFSGRRVLYYRKPVWSMFRSFSMKHLLDKQYTEISPEQALCRIQSQRMGSSRLRLVPKLTGVRPIALLCKRDNSIDRENISGRDLDTASTEAYTILKNCGIEQTTSSGVGTDRNGTEGDSHEKRSWAEQYKSTNAMLQDAFQVLKYEYEKDKDLFGAGLLGLHEFYPRFRQFTNELRQTTSSKGPSSYNVYFASVDIRHCYDNIDQEHLIKTVGETISGDDYMINRCSVLYSCKSMDRVLKKRITTVGPPENYDTLHKQSPYMTSYNHDSLFIDEATSTITNADTIMSLLREHLRSHIVVAKARHGNRYLLQKRGIPQGSVLSSFLCNFYYGDVEQDLLGKDFFPQKPKTIDSAVDDGSLQHVHMLVRIIDDFLLITTDEDMHTTFLQIMCRGRDELGVHVNREKIYSNVDITLESSDGTLQHIKDVTCGGAKGFPWCGMLLNTESCEVMIDYSRFAEGRAGNSLTVARAHNEGDQLRLRMKTFVRPRCLAILYDPCINSQVRAEENFFELMVLCAVKTVEYVRSSDLVLTTSQDIAFLFSCFDEAMLYAFHRIQDQLQEKQKKKLYLTKRSATALGWYAFGYTFREVKAFRALQPHIKEKLRHLPCPHNIHCVSKVREIFKQVCI